MAEQSVESSNRTTVKRQCPPELVQARVATQFTSEYQPGNKSAGALVRTAVSEMAVWTRAQLKAVVDDEDSPMYRVTAAARLLASIDGSDFDRIVNHTNGCPVQRNETESVVRYVRTVRLPANGRN
jgi:hypothetical protein